MTDEKPYEIFIDDNYDHHDESARYSIGRFATLEEAIAVCRQRVDDNLADAYKPGMQAEQLFEQYVTFGEDPWICGGPPQEDVLFSAWDYARKRCWEICRPVSE